MDPKPRATVPRRLPPLDALVAFEVAARRLSFLEAANELAHTPVLVQTDTVSGDGSPFARALWREHQRRMAERLEGLGGDLPRTGIPQRDPWGLRAAAALLFVTAFAVSFGPLGGRLGDAHGKAAPCEVQVIRLERESGALGPGPWPEF